MGHETVMRWLGNGPAVQDSYRLASGEELLFDKKALGFVAQAVPADDTRINALFTSLEKLRVLVRSQSAELVVVLLPSKEEIFAPGITPDGVSAVARVRQRFQATAIPVLDLYPVFRERGALQSPYFSRDIHLNTYGNRLVAEQLVAWLHSHPTVWAK
jgi:hypothetical protein